MMNEENLHQMNRVEKNHLAIYLVTTIAEGQPQLRWLY